jgi:predicted RNA binding protein YcfA (HicA-like mRNA interferase family)
VLEPFIRRLLALKPRQVIQALERADFFIHRVTGGHYALRHRRKRDLRVTVAHHNRDPHSKTLRSIIRQAGLSVDEFIGLL